MSRLALLGGDPVRAKPWPSWPDVREEDVAAAAAVVRSGRWWQHEGDQVAAFEREFAEHHGAGFGVAVNSGTAALHIALEALGIGPGDEVIVPAYTFQATASSVLLSGAAPVFADVESGTMNIDPGSAADLISDRTRAIIPVHIAGLPAPMDGLIELAKESELLILEDAAQAHGAIWRGRKVGSIGDAGAFSFQASKNLPSGEGGIILTSNKETYTRASGLRDCGRLAGRPFYEHHFVGYNSRMTEMQAALLRSRLRHLEAETRVRYRNGRRLTERLSRLPGVSPIDPDPGENDRRAYHLYPIRLQSVTLDGLKRERFMEALRAEGVPCMAGYGIPVYRNPVFTHPKVWPRRCAASCELFSRSADFSTVACPVAERLCDEVVWLPHSLLLGSGEDMDDIVRAVDKVVEGRSELVSAQRPC